MASISTTLAAVPGQSGSGGSDTQNFCYDEENRLVWAGNSGTQPAPGIGTCGSGTLANSLSGASYSSSYAYTHLGQLWQGPLNGSGTQQQYLYCNSSHPHQLTGLYPLGTTCSNLTGATYTSSTDTWGNVTSRVSNGTTATLSYDLLDHFVQWNAGASSQEWYAYDMGGNRTLRRSTTDSGTTITVYAFGLEEHVYSSSGTPQSSTYYYALGGRLLGELQGSTTQFFLTDALGSVLTTFNATAGSAAVQGNQVYGPYGNSRYSQGSMGTTKGFTGQYADATGLDYYNARYYDPVVGRFLSTDAVQGNGAGMDPYDYVGGNPETFTDPTGNAFANPASLLGGNSGSGSSCNVFCTALKNLPSGGSSCGQACQKFQPCQIGSSCHVNTILKGPTYHMPVKIGGTVSSWHICGNPCISINIATPPQTISVPIETSFVGQSCLTAGVLHSCGGDVSDSEGEEGQSKSNILASDSAGDAVEGGSQQTDPQADAFAKKVFKKLANSVAKIGPRVVAVNLSEDGNTLISINEISTRGGITRDDVALKLRELDEQFYDARYVGPTEPLDVGANFEDLAHAEVWIARVVEAERLSLRIGTALRAPCVVCYDILEYTGSLSP